MIDPELALQIVRDDRGPIAYDTETSGLEVKDFVVGYVITNREHSLYIPVRHEPGGNIHSVDEFEAALSAAFAERSRAGYLTVGHHLGFDLRMSLKHGVELRSPLEDTMINMALIDDLTDGYSLEDCAIRFKVTLKKNDVIYQKLANAFGGLADKRSMKNFWRLPGDDPDVIDYATGDGVSTLELWEKQQPHLDEKIGGYGSEGDEVYHPGFDLRRVHKLECDLLPYLARIHHRGIKVDSAYAERMLDENNPDGLTAKIKEARSRFEPGFNPRSPQEVEALFRGIGYRDEQFDRTPKGAVSFKEGWLEKSDLGEAILDIRRLEKLRDSFITPLTVTHNVNGRVHAVLNQSKSDEYGVAGARLSCSDPNLQAFPKRNKMIGGLVRPLLVPDFGMIYEDDFSQQEPRMFTDFARPPALVHGYMTGTMDIHDRSNEIIFGGKDRDKAKRLGMGMLTMLGEASLAMKLGIPKEEAKRLKRMFLDDAYPEIRDFQQDVIATFRNRGFVFSKLRRRSYLEDKRYAYQGVSRIIQNSGGDHTKTALLSLCQYEDAFPNDFQVLMTIHDSFIFQSSSVEHAREAQRLLEKAAPDIGLEIPIPVDVGFGNNWGEASYIKRGKQWWLQAN